MRKQDVFIISVVIASIVGWGVYEYYDFIQLQKKSVIEMEGIQKQSMAELLKPRGQIGLENKSNKHVEIRITNSSNEITRWEIFKPGGSFASYGAYEAGDVKLELTINGEVKDTVIFALHEGGEVHFDVYEEKLKAR